MLFHMNKEIRAHGGADQSNVNVSHFASTLSNSWRKRYHSYIGKEGDFQTLYDEINCGDHFDWDVEVEKLKGLLASANLVVDNSQVDDIFGFVARERELLGRQ